MSRWLLLWVLLVALSLRLWSAFSDLPYVYHPDEPHNLRLSQQIFKSGDLNPHWFEYPSLFYYINAAAYVSYYLVGRGLGLFATPADVPDLQILVLGTVYAPSPSVVVLGRLLNIVFGLGVVLLLYLIGRTLASHWVGLLSALSVAVSPVNVIHSRFITPDTLVTFWSLATLFAASLILQGGQTRTYLLAALAAGLTASTKYNGGVIILVIFAAHFLRMGRSGFKDWRIYLVPIVSLLGFVMTTPFAVLDYPAFRSGLTTMLQHYSTGHAGMEGDTLAWYLNTLWRSEALIAGIALVQLVRGIIQRHKPTLLVGVFPIAYFVLIASVPVRNDRTLLPLVPYLDLLAAMFLVDTLQAARTYYVRTRWRVPLMIAVILICLALPLATTIQEARRRLQVDSRATARVWITDNVQPMTRLALESYAPFVPPDRYQLTPVERMIDNSPAWYRERGVEYLVFSVGMFGRFYEDPERYAQQVAAYDAFFNTLPLEKRFNDGGYEVRIYRVPPTP